MGSVKFFKVLSWILSNVLLVFWLIVFLMKISGKLTSWTCVLSTLSFSVFVIMTSVKLDEPKNENVSIINCLIPLWVFLGLAMLLRDDSRKKKNEQPRFRNRGIKKVFKIFYPNAIVYFTIYTILEVISQEVTPLSWTVRFIPFFIFIATTILTLLSMIPKPGPEFILIGLVNVFLLLLYLYLIDKIGHIAIPFIPVYILIPVGFVFGLFI
ncbi:hypothetical protein DICPUDRAFT_81517 [Dictyostelium purpureum]|uniref:Uncharacterized protein n=1 Tax=Dictyostelium purpureum TaxID=5786 RepID=F0ZTQ8_DICPU|nr:uncharacterized protein DICPUDRAFT_81517 [Dictyostelium purpureum]EGC32673.1 hypothetical protein DICPUDRAFT_81517 [Dictyostelium purpureum]|eukprot:XP_003290806.1 hypothetical protein DICPUDRAFT_81517 [Dictyostelium purpureum]